jgi:hypothetical protein
MFEQSKYGALDHQEVQDKIQLLFFEIKQNTIITEQGNVQEKPVYMSQFM